MYIFIHALAAISPLTGEQKSVWPWVVGGIGLAALIAFVVLSILQKKKKEAEESQTADTASVEDSPLQETVVEKTPAVQEPAEDTAVEPAAPTNDEQDAP